MYSTRACSSQGDDMHAARTTCVYCFGEAANSRRVADTSYLTKRWLAEAPGSDSGPGGDVDGTFSDSILVSFWPFFGKMFYPRCFELSCHIQYIFGIKPMSLDCVWRFSKRWKKGAIRTVVFPKWENTKSPRICTGLLRNPQVSDLWEDRGLRLPQLFYRVTCRVQVTRTTVTRQSKFQISIKTGWLVEPMLLGLD